MDGKWTDAKVRQIREGKKIPSEESTTTTNADAIPHSPRKQRKRRALQHQYQTIELI
jgi:hypothetical protein